MRSAAASALAVVLMCACKADDQVLTPDDQGARDATVSNDGSTSPVVGGGAGATLGGGGTPGGGDASITSPGSDASSAGDATTAVDATVVTDAAPGDDSGSGQVTHTAKDPDCDMNGVWIARQNAESIALLLSQYSNNWYLLEFNQDGEQVVVANHMDCGIKVLGALATVVEIKPETTRALIAHNRQIGRKGSFAKQGDGTCSFQMEKFWSVRGVSEEMYAPKPRNRDATIQQLQAENPLPTRAGAEDWDNDGVPGIAWYVMGLVNGTRSSGQRDWTRWFSAPGYQVAAAMDFTTDLVVRAEFSNEEVVYEPTGSSSLTTLSEPNALGEHAMTMRFLGRTREDPRAQAILKTDDLQTCMAIQAALPAIEGLK